jgi:U3 small nucleolar RNA-associated protein 14
LEEFQKEKNEDYENMIPEEKKVMKGWGAWAGIGIEARKPQVSEEDKLKKKIAQIVLRILKIKIN